MWPYAAFPSIGMVISSYTTVAGSWLGSSSEVFLAKHFRLIAQRNSTKKMNKIVAKIIVNEGISIISKMLQDASLFKPIIEFELMHLP